jgi:phosphatidylethanolamine/phosphatidyl-N-methylethanolamine N-methyltransferase
MDAATLAFPSGRFDAVYAPYVLNAVPDPVAVGVEMLRVCRPGGRIVLVNHFDRRAEEANPLDRLAGELAARLSKINWHLELESFLASTGMTALSVDRVNVGRVSSVVVCRERADRAPQLNCCPASR